MADVAVQGSGFQQGEEVQLLWHTFEGRVKANGHMYAGREFQPKTIILGSITADGVGSFTDDVRIPYDYGGDHVVTAKGSSGLNANFTFFLKPQLAIGASKGPAGTEIAFKGSGFGWGGYGWGPVDNTWHVNYDNKYVGWFSGINTKGNVSFSIYASGDPGLHKIDVYANPYGATYLNLQEGFPEFKRLPRFHFDFEVVEGPVGEPVSRVIWDVRPETGTATGSESGSSLILAPSSGTVGTSVKVRGFGFGPSEEVEVSWASVVGSYLSPTGFINQSRPLASATADASGSFELGLVVPYDVGGYHEVQVIGLQTHRNATSFFYLARSATIHPTSGPAGTEITIEIRGVGWKSWENIAAFNYDNAHTGYACALGSEPGNITIFLSAVGSPGKHVIDAYPAIFRGPLTINYHSLGGVEPDIYRLPLLTPGELPQPVPIFHFEFIITAEEKSAPSILTAYMPQFGLALALAVTGVVSGLYLRRRGRGGSKLPVENE